MSINISIPDVGGDLRPQITVLGVGGSGGNAVNNMMNSNLEGVDFLIANTDAQALAISKCKKKIQLGINSTKGLGAGMRPDVGRQAAEEAIEDIVQKLEGSHMLFIAAGMGGGTGTGAAPVIAKLARERGILTVGVVTKPFHFEGMQRMKLAEKGLEELQQYVDTLLTIPNQNLFRIANEKTTFADAFKMADDVLYAGVRGVTDLMVQPGLINLDFSDVKTVMSEMGKAMMGTGEASGDGRAVAAAEAAIANPLIDDVSLKGARGLIINITGGNDITLYEVDEAANRIKQEVDENANIIYGTTCDDRLEGVVRVSIVATGIDYDSASTPQPLETTTSLAIDNSVYQQPKEELFPSNLEVEKDNAINQLSTEEENFLPKSESDENINEEDEINSLSSSIIHEENLVAENEIFSEKDDIKISDDIINLDSDKEKEILSENNNQITTNSSPNQVGEIDDNPPLVRKLSLFDSLENPTSSEDSANKSEDLKSEPIFNEQIQEESASAFEENNFQADEGNEANEVSEDENYNQENDEELLDIPTFLRRQAN